MNASSNSEKRAELLKRGVGVSQVKRRVLNDCITSANLECFLTTLGWIVNYDFDKADATSVFSLLEQTDFAGDQWCTYELIGTHSARMQLAKNADTAIAIKIDVPVELLAQARLCIEIFTTFSVSNKTTES